MQGNQPTTTNVSAATTTQIPSSAKRRIRNNVWGNWYGYTGSRRTIEFFNSPTHTQEQAANFWLIHGVPVKPEDSI